MIGDDHDQCVSIDQFHQPAHSPICHFISAWNHVAISLSFGFRDIRKEMGFIVTPKAVGKSIGLVQVKASKIRIVFFYQELVNIQVNIQFQETWFGEAIQVVIVVQLLADHIVGNPNGGRRAQPISHRGAHQSQALPPPLAQPIF